MIRLLADEDFDNRIVTGLRAHHPQVDFLRVQGVGLSSAPDADVLEFAAANAQLVVSHDVHTMVGHAIARINAGLPMPGLVIASQFAPIRLVIEDLLLMAQCSEPGEWEGQIVYLPWPRIRH